MSKLEYKRQTLTKVGDGLWHAKCVLASGATVELQSNLEECLRLIEEVRRDE